MKQLGIIPTQSGNRPTIALYARVSTKDKGQTVENQIRQLAAYARRMRWKVYRYTFEDQITGVMDIRPGLARLMEAAARHEFDAVLIWDLSRLTRRGPASAFEMIERLASSGVELWSMTEEHFRTPIVGKLLIAIAAFIAEQERANISNRVKAGIERARANGTVLGRPERIFDRSRLARLRSEGLSIRKIAARLKLSKSTVERSLSSEHKSSPPPAATVQPKRAKRANARGGTNSRSAVKRLRSALAGAGFKLNPASRADRKKPSGIAGRDKHRPPRP